jgi:signal peptidase I
MKFRNILSILGEFFEITAIMAAVVVLCYIFVGQLLEVDGDSMFPTFKHQEQIVAEKLTLNYRKPERGEVMIFEHPTAKGELIIKRVIGMPQERLLIKDNSVYINDNILNEPYLTENTITEGNITIKENTEFLIPENHYVLMGDNRGKSTDSRYWGPISIEGMVGRGLFVYYPTANFRLLFGK